MQDIRDHAANGLVATRRSLREDRRAPLGGVRPGHDVGTFHLAFAAAVFLMLGLMSLRFATRTAMPPGLPLRERIGYALGFTPPGRSTATAAEIGVYRVSGFVILIGVAIFYPMTKAGWDWLLVLEAVMLVAFGVAWFLKGTTLPGKSG
jgi:hypothetical protein